jgi:hypothetical protein
MRLVEREDAEPTRHPVMKSPTHEFLSIQLPISLYSFLADKKNHRKKNNKM